MMSLPPEPSEGAVLSVPASLGPLPSRVHGGFLPTMGEHAPPPAADTNTLLQRMPPLVLAVSLVMTHADVWAQDDGAATMVSEISVTEFSPASPVPPHGSGAPAATGSADTRGSGAASATATLIAATDPAVSSQSAVPEAHALGEVRIYGTVEKDQGFAPTQAETATKAPAQILTTPQSISVVTREEIESRQVNNLQDALQTVAGASPVNFGRRGFDDIILRGFRTTESVLIDGLTQTPSLWTRLQSYGYERFEVLKGANSVLYGQMQPGGVINAISKRPRPEAMGEVVAEVGNFGHRSIAADLNRPVSESGRAAFRVNAIAVNDRDPTDQVWRRDRWLAPSLSLDFGAHTDFVLFGTYSHSTWIRQQGSSPYGTLLANPNGPVSPRMFTGDPSLGAYDVEQYTVGYNLQHRFANGMTLRQNVRHEKEKGHGNFVSLLRLQANQRLQNRRGTRQELDYDLTATDTSLLMPFEAWGMKHQVVAGLDARTGHSHMTTRRCTIAALNLYAPVYGMPVTCNARYERNNPSKLTVAGLYAQDQIRLDDRWTVVAGLRHERSRDDIDNRLTGVRRVQKDHDTTGSAGVSYEFRPGWAAYASYSRSFLPVSGQDAQGRYFVPETANQKEVGLKYVLGGVNGSVAVFDLRRQHVSVSDPDNEGFNIQVGEQRARGVELEAGVDLGNGLNLVGAYTFIDAEVTADTNASLVGKPVEMTAKHVLALWADWRVPALPAVSVGLGGRYVGTQKGDVSYDLPSYALADLSVAYTGHDFRVTLGVKNLFDRTYYVGAINENVVSPGMPRTYLLTFKYLF